MPTMARPHQRASSTASSSLSSSDKQLPPYRPSALSSSAPLSQPTNRDHDNNDVRGRNRRAASASSSTSSSATAVAPPTSLAHNHHRHHHLSQPPTSSSIATTTTTATTSSSSASSTLPSVYPSVLQPRVALVLKVPPPWHPWLFALRLCSILPALWWGLPAALQLLLRVLPGSGRVLVVRPGWIPPDSYSPQDHLCDAAADPRRHDATVPFALTEGALATIWCFACGYLSFFFTDCLMSRWLINYTPQATIVRLLTINAVNAYVTLTMLSLTGGFDDHRLLLPGWIGIATTLTVCYHITHQKINIRKETSTSINVFSFASYLTMIVLLVHMHSHLPNYPTMPIVARARRTWNESVAVLVRLKGAIERAEL